MAKELQLRGGTTAQHSIFTGAVREVTVDTDKDTLVVHDGVTAGGTPLAKESSVPTNTSDLTNDSNFVNSTTLSDGLATKQNTLVSGSNIKTLNGESVLGSGDLQLSGGATGGGNDRIFVENGQTVTTSYTIPTGSNAMTTGDITINTGVTVTVPTGSRWVII